MGGIGMKWEEGQIKTWTIAATAGNATASLASTAYKKYLIIYGRITLVCDATVANRYIIVNIQNSGGTVTYRRLLTNATAITASQTRSISYVDESTNRQGESSDLADIGLGQWCVIASTDKIVISVYGGVAGDSYSGAFKYIELPD